MADGPERSAAERAAVLGGEPLPWRATALAVGLALEGWVVPALWRWLTHG